MIDGVRLRPLPTFSDTRGSVLRLLRLGDMEFNGIREIYFSTISALQVKPWRRHRTATCNLAVPIGVVNLYLFDDRDSSPTVGTTWSTTLGLGHYHLLTIPPMIWFALQNPLDSVTLIANCSSEIHSPTSSDRRELDDKAMPQLEAG